MTIFLLVISTTIVLGLAGPVVQQIKIGTNTYKSRSSYFVAEAAIEDVLYRLKNNFSVSSSETLTLDGNTATVQVEDIGDTRLITTEGDDDGYIRKLKASVTVGVGASFNYGVQAGQGGFSLDNNAGIYGNVYSNGNIIGSNNNFITGSAIAANSLALVADQVNDLPIPPTSSIVFRNLAASQDLAQSFEVTTDSLLNKLEFYIKKTGGPANATVKIVRNSAGSPSTDSADVLGSGTLSASTITTNYGWTTVTLSSNPQLNSGTTYWVVIDNTSNSSVDFYTIGANSSYGNGQAKIGRLGSTWADTTPPGLDAFFKVYLGGVTSEIRDIIVGTTVSDRAHAHTANNVDMLGGGTLFCQTGASNNPACDTSLADPSPIAMPISDANIDQWKSDAEAGGVISGDYTPLSSSSSLGPKKIDGDLILPAGHTLIISGTIWVTGNIIAPNNINFQLDSDYELSGGIVMADGYINLSNNVNFFNSGEEGSNIMMLTTSSSDCSLGGACDTYDAVELSNNIGQNANGVIVVAQNGRVDFGNNVSVKAVVANKIHLSNNTTIDYETGLTNQNFVSGPGGTWNIKSWQEVE